MSLQVWLPLTKDLRQQGLNTATIEEVTNVTFDNSGKLGKCLSGGKIKIPANQVASIFNNTSMSIAFWYNNNTSETTGNHSICGFSGNTEGDTDAVRIWDFFNYANPNTFHWSMGTLGGGSLANVFPANTWVHVCVTWNAPTLKIYMDGVLKYTGSGSSNYTFDKSYYISFGRAPQKLSDFRIYNHCLSPMEVKELAKGLVLHYPLNRQGWGQENLIANTDFNGVSKKFTVTSGTEGGFTFTPTETITANTQYTVSCRLRGNANMNLYKLCTGGNESISWVNRSQLSTTEYRYFSIIFTYPSNKTLNQIYICTRYGTANTQVGDWFEIEPSSLKLEKGSIATPWCPNSSDELATTMGLNSTIEYDCSGFCNNGTRIGTFTWTSDTPKYQVSTVFTAEPNAISSVTNFSHLTTFTYNCWIKTNTAHNAFVLMGYQYGNNTSGSLALDSGTSKAGFHYYAYAGGQGDVTIGSNVNYYDNQWHMLTATYDGSKIITYFDGVKTAEGSVSLLTSSRTFSLNQPSGASGRYFKGQMSDARVYATALSADDVKSLYQNCATIDPDGTIRGQIRN